ncbi:hypothetical protein LguiB_004652 [Lonicera macranthoides]
MATRGFLIVTIFSVLVFTGYGDDGVYCSCSEITDRSSFPPGFVFGAAGAAYQCCRQKRTMPDVHIDLSNGDVAVDSYHRYKEDVAIAKNLGLDAYRFSISWTRILPYGSLNGGPINQKGIDYYNNLINEIIAQGLDPYVTIFHWDVPQALEEAYGGFLNSRIVEDYRTYAEVLFSNFGDRVKNWITFNEPWSFSDCAYAIGMLAPGRCSEWQRLGCLGGDSGTEPYWVTHHQLLAHAAAVDTYRQKYQETQQGRIGITLVSQYYEPYSNTSDDQEAQQRALDFMLGWFLHPITYGDYPQSMRYLVGSRLPDFTANDIALLKGSYDFLGLNYYTTSYAINAPNSCGTRPSYLTDSQVNQTCIKDGVPIGAQSGADWLYIYPIGFRGLLNYIKEKYNNPPIIITENGVCEKNIETSSVSDACNDTMRKDYIHDHMCCLQEAIFRDNVNVIGYIVWSLLDNYEWASGYTVRFGLYYVDYKNNLKRHEKISAKWLKSILTKPIPHSLPRLSDQ